FYNTVAAGGESHRDSIISCRGISAVADGINVAEANCIAKQQWRRRRGNIHFDAAVGDVATKRRREHIQLISQRVHPQNAIRHRYAVLVNSLIGKTTNLVTASRITG